MKQNKHLPLWITMLIGFLVIGFLWSYIYAILDNHKQNYVNLQYTVIEQKHEIQELKSIVECQENEIQYLERHTQPYTVAGVTIESHQTIEIPIPWTDAEVGAAREYTPIDCELSLELQDYTFALCQNFGLDFYMVMAVMKLESNFNPNELSKSGDYGLMQINICNHDWLTALLGIEDYFDPYDNILAGCYMLANLANRYETMNQILMCYNKGENGAKALWKRGVNSNAYTWLVNKYMTEFKAAIED